MATRKGGDKMGLGWDEYDDDSPVAEAYEVVSQSEEAVEAVVYEIEHGDDD